MTNEEYRFKEMMDLLRNLEYVSSSGAMGEIHLPVIKRDHLSDVERIIRKYLLDNHDERIGMLQAKVYAYEKIIANSNFAPMIADSSDNQKKEELVFNFNDIESEEA